MTYFPTNDYHPPAEGSPEGAAAFKRKGDDIAQPNSSAGSVGKTKKVEQVVKVIITPADIEVAKSMSKAKFYSKYDAKIFTGEDLSSAEKEELGNKLVRKYTKLSGKGRMEDYTPERIAQIADAYINEKTTQSLERIKEKTSKFDTNFSRTFSAKKGSPSQLKKNLKKVAELANKLENDGYKDEADKVKQIYEDAINGKLERFPISSTSIEKGAHLKETIRKARAFAHTNEALRVGDFKSVNTVYKVGLKPPPAPKGIWGKMMDVIWGRINPPQDAAMDDPSSLVAFFKTGSADAQSSAIMEKLMWDVANILGFERSFAATENIDLRLRKSGESGSAPQISESGELEMKKELGSPMKGGIQPPLPGMILEDYFDMDEDKRTAIQKNELNRSVLISTVFGMYDAHGGNIFITPNGELMFFDNARSLPHSNGFIFFGGRDALQPAYRCALLELPDVRKNLTIDERQDLLADAERCKSRLYDLRAFFDSPITKQQLNKLPPGWADPEAMVASMEERVDALISNLEGSNALTLLDLATRSNPGYQLAFGISFLSYLANNQTKEVSEEDLSNLAGNFHSYVGNPGVLKHFMALDAKGYDIGHVIELSEKSLNLDEFIKELIAYHKTMIGHDLPAERPRNYNALQYLSRGVHLDNKETPSNLCRELLLNEELFKALAKKGYPNYQLNCSDPECLAVPEKEFIIRGWKGEDRIFAYWTNYGLRFCPFRLSNVPGNILLGPESLEVPIEKAAERIIKGKKHTELWDLPVYRSDLQGKELFLHGNKVEIFGSDKQIVAFFKASNGNIYKISFEYDDGEYFFEKENSYLTLDEVIAVIKSYDF